MLEFMKKEGIINAQFILDAEVYTNISSIVQGVFIESLFHALGHSTRYSCIEVSHDYDAISLW